MSDFIILTDSSADLGADLTERYNIQVLPLSFIVAGETYHNYPDNREMAPEVFYQKMREGVEATTSAVNVGQYTDFLEPQLRAGRDVLILSFSSALSATCSASQIAAEELREQYPQRKIYVVDTLCASLGQGLLVCLAAQERAKGRSIEEVRDFAEKKKTGICHQFTVDDLHFLKRGGRISSTTAFVGSMLQIKPVLTFADDGQLQSIAKVRGRQQVMRKLVELTVNRCGSHKRYNLAVANGGSPEEMETVRRLLTEALPHGEHLWDGEIDGTLSVYIGDGVLGAAVQVLD